MCSPIEDWEFDDEVSKVSAEQTHEVEASITSAPDSARVLNKTRFRSQREMREFMGCAEQVPDADAETRLREIMPEKFVVTATLAGNLLSIKKRGHGKATLRRLSKTECVVESTGEVRQYSPTALYRGANERGVRNRLEACRLLVAYNETRFASALFITLTFAVGRSPEEGLGKDLKSFLRRLRKFLGTRGHLDKRPVAERVREGRRYATEYVALVERHDSGFLHLHVILFQAEKRFVSVDVVKEAWGLGFVYVNSRQQSQEVFGRYLSADACQEYENVGYEAAAEHAMEKYEAFLSLPRGFRFVRTSKGLEKPPSQVGYVDPTDLPRDAEVLSKRYSEHKGENGRVHKNFRVLLRRPGPIGPRKKRKR